MNMRFENRIQRGRHGRVAMTLAEVVTCIVTLSMVGGVSLATLARVRGASQSEVCLNNLRQIAAASADYAADDPRENAIPVHHRFDSVGSTVIGDYQYGGKSGNVNSAAYYRFTIEGNFGSFTRPLNPYLYDVYALVPPECRDFSTLTQECIDLDKSLDLAVYRCPSDTGKTGLHYSDWGASGRSGYDYFGASYNATVGMICDGSGGPMLSVTPFQRSRSGVPNPSRTMMYMDTCGRYAWAWGYGPWSFGTGFTVGGWHGEDWRFNMAFVDGHAANVYMRGQGASGIIDSADDVEFIPGLPGGMANWWQVITRGEDWQLDCLPAPAIPTNKRCSGGIGTDADSDPQTMTLSPPGLD
jgi:prepilin-type processing-associated H-X9-DG protein